MPHTVSTRKSADKAVEKLNPKDQAAVEVAIAGLATTPRPLGCDKLKGKRAGLYKIRVGDFRIIYDVDDAKKVVEVVEVVHRGATGWSER